MAEFHLQINISHDCCESAAYATRGEIGNTTTNVPHDYRYKGDDLIATNIILPKGAPEEWKDPAVMWNEVARVEKYKDAQQCRTWEISLPVKDDGTYFTDEEYCAMLDEYFAPMVEEGMCVNYGIHKPDKKNPNPHAHVCSPTRPVDPETGKFMAKSKKVYEYEKDEFGNDKLDEKGKPIKCKMRDANGNPKKDKSGHYVYKTHKIDLVNKWNDRATLRQWRERWAEIENRELEKAGCVEFVSAKSYKAQGCILLARPRLPRKSWNIREQYKLDTILQKYDRIDKINAKRVARGKKPLELPKIKDKQKQLLAAYRADIYIERREQIEKINAKTRRMFPFLFNEKGKQIMTYDEGLKMLQEQQKALQQEELQQRAAEIAAAAEAAKLETVTKSKETAKLETVTDTKSEQQARPSAATQGEEARAKVATEKTETQSQTDFAKSETGTSRTLDRTPATQGDTPAVSAPKPPETRKYPTLYVNPDDLTYKLMIVTAPRQPDDYTDRNGVLHLHFATNSERTAKIKEINAQRRAAELPADFPAKSESLRRLPTAEQLADAAPELSAKLLPEPKSADDGITSRWGRVMERNAKRLESGPKTTVEKAEDTARGDAWSWYKQNIDENSFIKKVQNRITAAFTALKKWARKTFKANYTATEIAGMNIDENAVNKAVKMTENTWKSKLEHVCTTTASNSVAKLRDARENAKFVLEKEQNTVVEPRGTFEFESSYEHRCAVKAYKVEFASSMINNITHGIKVINHNATATNAAIDERNATARELARIQQPDLYTAKNEIAERKKLAPEMPEARKARNALGAHYDGPIVAIHGDTIIQNWLKDDGVNSRGLVAHQREDVGNLRVGDVVNIKYNGHGKPAETQRFRSVAQLKKQLQKDDEMEL